MFLLEKEALNFFPIVDEHILGVLPADLEYLIDVFQEIYSTDGVRDDPVVATRLIRCF